MPVLGLFPLNIVLFPNASYPLHIFEERYKTLVKEAMGNNQEFGINLVEGGKMFEVGCRVKVTRVLKDYPDGRKDIVVTGTTRYRILKVRPNETAYITAEIANYSDESPEVGSEMLDHALRLYNELIERIYGEAEEQLKEGRLAQRKSLVQNGAEVWIRPATAAEITGDALRKRTA